MKVKVDERVTIEFTKTEVLAVAKFADIIFEVMNRVQHDAEVETQPESKVPEIAGFAEFAPKRKES